MPRTPRILRHSSGQAMVRLSGHNHYLGVWNPDDPEPPVTAREKYHRLLAEWERRGRKPAAPGMSHLPKAEVDSRISQLSSDSHFPFLQVDARLIVTELVTRYLVHAESYYRTPDGKPTAGYGECVQATRPLCHLYGSTPAEDLGPLRLKSVRDLMVKGYSHPAHGTQPPLSRKTINDRVRRIIGMYRWGSEEELVPAPVWLALKSVASLKKGRTVAQESRKVPPVAPEVVEATLPFLTAHVAGIVRFQQVTGTRPTEALSVRLCDLDRSGDVWLYRPRKHKTDYIDKTRVVAIGPRGQKILLEFIRIACAICGVQDRPGRIGSPDGTLCGPCADRASERGIRGPWCRIEVQDPEAYLFSPQRCREEMNEDKRVARKSRVQPSQISRRRKGARQPGVCYGRHPYCKAVARAAAKAGVEEWHPSQLRHAAGVRVREKYGLDGAQASLGHEHARVTEVYAQTKLDLAVRIARDLG